MHWRAIFVIIICLLLSVTVGVFGFMGRQQVRWLPAAAALVDVSIALGCIKTVGELIKMPGDIKKTEGDIRKTELEIKEKERAAGYVAVATYDQVLTYAPTKQSKWIGPSTFLFVIFCSGMGTVLTLIELSRGERHELERLQNQNAILTRSGAELKQQVENLSNSQDVNRKAADAGNTSAMYNLGLM
jgi:hypothetical protein